MPEPIEFTSRGFAVYGKLGTDYGHEIQVSESSAAKGSFCWLFVEGGHDHADVGVHMSVEQVTQLRDALDAFLEHRGGGS